MATKLPRDQMAEIRRAYLEKPSMRAIAADMGISLATVHKAVKRGREVPVDDLPALVTESEHELRENAWENPGALRLTVRRVANLLQAELEKPMPEQLLVKGWSSTLKDLTLAFAVAYDKARLANDKPTSITAKAEQLVNLAPADLDNDMLVQIIQTKVTGKIHPSLLPSPAA